MVSLRANDGDDQLPEGDLRRKDLVIVLDGGRSGNDSAVNQALVDVNGRAMNKVKQCFTLLYDEESLGERKERVKGFVQQVEGLNVYSTEGLELEKCSRKHYSGTNHGTNIGPVRALPYDDPNCWRISPADKKLLYGDKGKILTGGACPWVKSYFLLFYYVPFIGTISTRKNMQVERQKSTNPTSPMDWSL